MAVVGRGVTARDLAARTLKPADRRLVEPSGMDISLAGSSLAPRTSAQSGFEVAGANPGLCAALENAALCFASGKAADARKMLEEGLVGDPDSKASPHAWLALFDLMQREGDKTAFDRLALEYVVQFERSAPSWEASEAPKVTAPRAVGGLIAITGKITAASSTQIESLKRAIARKAQSTRLDLVAAYDADDDGARLLAQALQEARRARVGLQLLLGNKLVPMLEAALLNGREAGQGLWLLSLELLQWTGNRAAFEDRAIEFAVAFELSPPSWEELPAASTPLKAAEERNQPANNSESETLRLTGVMAGQLGPQLAKFADLLPEGAVVAVDMSGVERVDFVCAGALLNVITRIEAQHKTVQLIGVSPVIRALLLLIGVSPRHFVKKVQ